MNGSRTKTEKVLVSELGWSNETWMHRALQRMGTASEPHQ